MRDSLDGYNGVVPQVQLFESSVVQLKDGAEAGHVLPEEAYQSHLTQDTYNIGSALLSNNDPMDTTTEQLDSFGQGVGMFQEGGGFLPPKKILNVVQGYRLVLRGPVQHVLYLRSFGRGRIGEIGDKEKIGIQVVVVVCAYGLTFRSVFAYKHNIGRA